MLKLIKNLSLFFEDCYRRVGVREYSKIIGISPPTASKMLKDYEKEGLLIKEKNRSYLLFYANQKNKVFLILSRLYWEHQLNELTNLLDKELISPTIILFGSLSKAETKKDSDIDLTVLAHKKDLDTRKFEKNLNRKVQIFWFKTISDIKDKEFKTSVANGYLLKGRIKF